MKRGAKLKQTERTEGLPEHVRQKETWSVYVIDLFKKGLSDDEIKEHLISQHDMSVHSVNNYLSSARTILRNDFAKDRETIIGLHLRRYDKDINNLISIQPRTNNWNKAIEIKTNAYLQLIELMTQKEKLLGFHSKKFNIQINNEVNVTVVIKPNKYDLSLLTFSEKIELMALLDKAKITGHEVEGIIPNPNKIVAKTIDIDYTDVTNEPLNITQIEKVGELTKQLPEQTQTAIYDARAKLQQALKLKAQEAFQRAGSKTAASEQIKK